MAITYNDNAKINAPKDIENKTGKFVTGAWVPYASVAEANSTILAAYRYKGLTVRITEGSGWAEYFYKNGTADGDLVRKVDLLDNVTYSSNQTAALSDLSKIIFLDTTSSSVTFTVNPSTFNKLVLRIYGIVPGSNVASITPSSGTINGGPSYMLLNGECITLYSNGTNLYVIGKN